MVLCDPFSPAIDTEMIANSDEKGDFRKIMTRAPDEKIQAKQFSAFSYRYPVL